jgi:hypothetical protein
VTAQVGFTTVQPTEGFDADYWAAFDADMAVDGMVRSGRFFDTGAGYVPEYAPTDTLPATAGAVSPIPPTKETRTMSTATLERPAAIVPPQREMNDREAFRAELDSREATRSLGDRIRSAPKALKGWYRGVLDTVRASSIGGTISDAGRSALGLLGRVMGPVKVVGLMNIFGALLTCGQGRRIIRKTVTTTYRIVTAPLRWAGRMVAGVLNRFGWGKRVVTAVTEKVDQAEAYVGGKFEAAMTWMDEREFSGGMRWGRAFYQGQITGRTVKHYAPENLKTPLYIATMFLPTVGTSLGMESKTNLVSSTARSASVVAQEVSQTAQVVEEALETPAQDWKVEYVQTFDGTTLSRTQMFTDADGDRWIKLGGQLFEANDIPEGWKYGRAAEVAAQTAGLQAQAERAAASSNGDAPLPRAAQREADKQAKKATAKAHGPAGRR